jgi:DNA-binding IclR family transcriptional regulator
MVLAITAIGPSAAFDARWSGPLAQLLLNAARGVSARLGNGPVMPRGSTG